MSDKKQEHTNGLDPSTCMGPIDRILYRVSISALQNAEKTRRPLALFTTHLHYFVLRRMHDKRHPPTNSNGQPTPTRCTTTQTAYLSQCAKNRQSRRIFFHENQALVMLTDMSVLSTRTGSTKSSPSCMPTTKKSDSQERA